MNPYYPRLFEPITVGPHVFRNRIWSGPSMMCHMDAAGFPTEYMIAYYAEKARGGAAVVTVGDTPVDRLHAATNPRSFNLSRASLPQLSELAMAIHEGGAKASLELNHGGFVARPAANNGSAPIGPVDFVRDWDGVHVTGMNEAMMDEVAGHFADCAALLKTAGFDMCLIHGGHGWLLDQFISPLYNTRNDQYGGPLEARARFPLMVVDRVRARCGSDFLIEYRFSVSEEIEGGLTKAEGVEFAKLLDGEVDILHCSCGLDIEDAQAVHLHPTMFLPHGVNVHYAQAVKAAGVKSPVLTIGAITDPALAESILEDGKADIVGMTRALIADPYLPEKAKHGRAKEIRPCLRCLDCLTGMITGQHFQCSVNQEAGREFRYRNYLKPPVRAKKVLVVGGGPGGMTAAATAAQRGHDVTLAEKTGALGGLLKFTDHDPLKVDLMRLKDYLIHQVEISGVSVLLDAEVTADLVREGAFDTVIVAAGSTPARPPIPGLDDPAVKHATSVYTDAEAIGPTVTVVGGGLTGCEIALFLAGRGHRVTIVDMLDRLASDANFLHREGMMQSFAQAGIVTRTGLTVTRVAKNGVCVKHAHGAEESIPGETVVYALGMHPNTATVKTLMDSCIDVVAVGDCVAARKVRNAMEEGFNAATRLG